MTQAQRSGEVTSVSEPEATATAWVGWIFFAAVILILVGCFQAISGLAALFEDDVYAVTSNHLVVHMSYTAWGWIHLGLGAAAVLAGYGVLKAQLWARVYAIVLASFSAIANLAFLSAYPIWGTMMIAFDVLVIYALAVHGREMQEV